MTTVTTPKKKQCRKLTREEKKAVWNAETDENAGAGWNAKGNDEPRSFYPNRERDTTPTVDKEFK